MLNMHLATLTRNLPRTYEKMLKKVGCGSKLLMLPVGCHAGKLPIFHDISCCMQH
jgi:hypothetical protein